MSFLVFILAAATVSALSAPRTQIDPIESLRFNTRSPSGWLLLVTLIVLPLEVFLLVARFLNFSWVIEHIKIALGIVSGDTVCLIQCRVDLLGQAFPVYRNF